MHEVMLHDTGVVQMRVRLVKTGPQEPWKDTEQEYATRLERCAAYTNDSSKVKERCL